MLIKSNTQERILVQLENMNAFKIRRVNNTYCVVAIWYLGSAPIGVYNTEEEAIDAKDKLFEAVGKGKNTFVMP